VKRLLVKALCVFIYLSTNAENMNTEFSFTKTNNKVIVDNENSRIVVEAWRNDMIKVSWHPDKNVIKTDSSYTVILEQESKAKLQVKDKGGYLEIKSGQILARLNKSQFNLHFYTSDGRTLLESVSNLELDGTYKTSKFKIQPADHFYGMGQKSIAVDRRGEAFDVFNQHIGGYTRPYGTMQINTPYIYSSTGFGVYFDNHYPARFDLGKTNPKEWFYKVENGSFSYYFTVAPDEQVLLKNYFDLTGYAPLQPKWTFGLIQSKCAYDNDQDVYQVLEKFENKKLPLDAIVLDIPWFGGFKPGDPHNMGNFSWFKRNFPDPDRYIATLRDLGLRTIAVNEPYINLNSFNYNYLKNKGWLVPKKGQTKPHVFSPFWAGDASLLDITNPAAQAWLWTQLKAEIESGVDGLWNDLVEPEHPVVDGQYYIGDWRKTHNIFSLIWAKNIADGYAKDFPNRRVFNLSRAGFAGIQRYGVSSWSGDASKTWNALKLQIPMMTSTVMSGLPYFGSDIGGFTNAHDRRDGNTLFTNIVGGRMVTHPELYIRWFQHGIFSPVLRPHSGEEQYCEVFAFDSITEKITSEYLRLRYRFIPFIYSYAYKTYEIGETLIRPLFFEFNDPQARQQDYQYMFGKELLISPVLEEAKTKQDVYLPDEKQVWIDFWNNKTYRGGQTINHDAPLDIIPVFVKAGSIIPLGKNKMRAEELNDTITLRIYPGNVATFDLYEDDGISMNYQKGAFGITKISSKQSGKNLNIRIAAIQGEYPSMLKKRTWIFEIPVAADFKSISVNSKKMGNVQFDKEKGLIRFSFDAETKLKQNIKITSYKSTY
jgi:alpha-glucosidase (family GH31 glycosyl hydrolase)